MSSTPETPLQFNCPACSAVLTVPASIAGMQGPCPKCWQEIISPDPAIGLPARLPAPPKADIPFAPPSEPEPVVVLHVPGSHPEPKSDPAPAQVGLSKPLPNFPRRLDPAPAPDLPPEHLAPATPVAASAIAAPSETESLPKTAPPPQLDPSPSPTLPPEAAPIFPPGLDPEPVAAATTASPDAPVPPLTPPLPSKSEEAPPSRIRREKTPRPRSKALLALGIILPIVAIAALGYHFGKDLRPNIVKPSTPASPAPAKPNPIPGSAITPAPEPGPAPTPDETGQGLQPPPAPTSSHAEDAQAALVAFLGAPDWQARSAFVLFPDDMRPEMQKHAKEHGDGPIPASAIQLNEGASTPQISVFDVSTGAMPSGFPVGVVATDEGPKVDWESFIAFNDDHFRKLLIGPTDQSGILNLLAKPETGEEPSPHWVRYRLSAPMPGREATAWVSRSSVALARLKSVFDGEDQLSKEEVDRLVAEKGVPLRLAVTKRKTNDGREFLELIDMVAVGWAPAKRN